MLQMKSDEERGPIGAWARNARIAAGYTSAEHAAEAAGRAGIHVTLAYLRGIEAGWHRPGRALLEDLARFYGSEPPVSQHVPIPSAELDAIREAVAAGVALGIARALDATTRAGPPPRRRPPSRQ